MEDIDLDNYRGDSVMFQDMEHFISDNGIDLPTADDLLDDSDENTDFRVIYETLFDQRAKLAIKNYILQEDGSNSSIGNELAHDLALHYENKLRNTNTDFGGWRIAGLDNAEKLGCLCYGSDEKKEFIGEHLFLAIKNYYTEFPDDLENLVNSYQTDFDSYYSQFNNGYVRDLTQLKGNINQAMLQNEDLMNYCVYHVFNQDYQLKNQVNELFLTHLSDGEQKQKQKFKP